MTNPRVLLLGRYGHLDDNTGIANATKNLVLNAVEDGFDYHIISLRKRNLITPELLSNAEYDSDQIHFDMIGIDPSKFSVNKTLFFEDETSRLTELILGKISDSRPIDLVHSLSSYPNYSRLAEKIAENLNVPYIISSRGGNDVYGHHPEFEYEPDKKWFLKPLSNAAFVTALSDFQMAKIIENLDEVGYSHAPLLKIPNGADVDHFVPLPKTDIPKGAIRAAYTGRIRKFKGVLDIVQAVQSSIRSGVNAELDLYGDGIALNEVRDYISERGLSEIVRCEGRFVPHSELPEMYRRHNLFIHASRCEGHPNSVMEAMACGLPVMLNYPSGSTEMLEDKSMDFETGNIEQMADIIIRLSKNPSELVRHGERNRRFAVENSWNVIAGKYADVYRKAIEGYNKKL